MTTKERQRARAMCSCGMVLGIYKIRFHDKIWEHHYLKGTLDKFYQQEMKKPENQKFTIVKS